MILIFGVFVNRGPMKPLSQWSLTVIYYQTEARPGYNIAASVVWCRTTSTWTKQSFCQIIDTSIVYRFSVPCYSLKVYKYSVYYKVSTTCNILMFCLSTFWERFTEQNDKIQYNQCPSSLVVSTKGGRMPNWFL